MAEQQREEAGGGKETGKGGREAVRPHTATVTNPGPVRPNSLLLKGIDV